MTLAKFRELTPNIDWSSYLRDVGLTGPLAKVNVAEPNFYKRLNELIAQTPVDDWRVYLRYHVAERRRALVEQRVRARELRLQSAVQRREVAAAALEAMPASDRRIDRRSAWPGVRREDVPAVGARSRQGA